ncbi:MAG TPA: hypothetical protein VMT77_09295, partial [Gemmatimonadales bacterium]|nr:hypothetical protein [Gemmatimonadales bacterium]
MTRRCTLLLALAAGLLAGARPAVAQAGADTSQVARAADSITPDDIRSGIAVIADDSMLGRATPSSQLEATAAWVASRFAEAGLRPGGDSGTWYQRYAIRRLRVDSTSFVMVLGRGAHGHWRLGREAAAIFGEPPAAPLTAPIVLIVGIPADTARPFGGVPMAGTIVVQVLDTSRIGNDLVPLVTRGVAEGVKAWIFVSNRSRAEFTPAAASALAP